MANWWFAAKPQPLESRPERGQLPPTALRGHGVPPGANQVPLDRNCMQPEREVAEVKERVRTDQ
jgi:hypothetical protein